MVEARCSRNRMRIECKGKAEKAERVVVLYFWWLQLAYRALARLLADRKPSIQTLAQCRKRLEMHQIDGLCSRGRQSPAVP